MNTRKIISDMGFCKRTTNVLVRLAEGRPTEREKKRWNELKVMQGDKIVMSKEEIELSGLTFCLFGSIWEGHLERVPAKSHDTRHK